MLDKKNTSIKGIFAGSAAALFMLLGASSASAASFSYRQSDVVEQNGLEWLKLTVTSGSNTYSVRNAFDDSLRGWRFATREEVEEAWTSVAQDDFLGNFIGITEPLYDMPEMQIYGTAGVIGKQEGDCLEKCEIFDDFYSWQLGDLSEGSGTWFEGDVTYISKSSAGFWVVKGGVADKAVPEPITGLVIAAGLGGSAMIRAWKRQK